MSAVFSYDRNRTVLQRDGRFFAFVAAKGMKPLSEADEKDLLGRLNALAESTLTVTPTVYAVANPGSRVKTYP